jgi:outer membrane lipoprotein carrier protein
MIALPLALLGGVFFLQARAVQTPALTAQDILRKAEAAAAAWPSFQADFEQTLYPSSLDTPHKEKGRLFYQKPGRMRWDYAEPKEERKTYVYDSGLLQSYFPADNQLIRQAIPEDGSGPDVFGLLSGRANLGDRYAVEISPFPTDAGPSHQLKLTPRDEEGETSYVLLEIDARTFFIRWVIAFDWAGNKNELRFSRLKTNPRLDPDTFRIKVPPDCEIIDDAPTRKR